MREIRHARLRKQVSGTAAKPRMAVFHSLPISMSISSMMKRDIPLRQPPRWNPPSGVPLAGTCNTEAAKAVGKVAAERALAKGHHVGGLRQGRAHVPRQGEGSGGIPPAKPA